LRLSLADEMEEILGLVHELDVLVDSRPFHLVDLLHGGLEQA
jgi:hypothetical protein